MYSLRFIPTPVGNIYQGYVRLSSLSVHPHACGEHLSREGMIFQRSGSSPRLWGTYRFPRQSRYRSRFIPTPVGNIPLPVPPVEKDPVHPHACGEHFPGMISALNSCGSSPRLWGTFSSNDLYLTHIRFIPTPVGNI